MKQSKDNKKEKKDDFALLEFSHKDSKTKRTFKSLALLIFNILVIAVIIIVEATSTREKADITTVLHTWGENWQFIIYFFVLLFVYYLCLAESISILIFSVTGYPHQRLSFSTAILGKYYDNITPFGSGGQPFQMYNLGKKLDVGLATSIPAANFIVQQLVFTVIAIIIFIVNSAVMAGNDFLRIAAYIGIVFFAAIPLAVLAFSLFPKAITGFLRFCCRVGHKIHLIKHLDKAEAKVTSGVNKYADSLRCVGKKWRYLVICALFAACGWWAYHSFPYVVLRICGVQPDYFDTMCMSVFIYSAITIVPTPGNAGAAEGVFYAIFATLSGEYLFWGIALWRFAVYYFPLLSGFTVTVSQYIQAAIKHRRTPLATAEAASDFSGESFIEKGGENSSESTSEEQRAENSSESTSEEQRAENSHESSIEEQRGEQSPETSIEEQRGEQSPEPSSEEQTAENSPETSSEEQTAKNSPESTSEEQRGEQFPETSIEEQTAENSENLSEHSS